MSEIINVPMSRQRDLNTVTAEIRTLQGQAQRMVLEYAIEIGRRLTEAKSMVPHGEWGTYLQEELGFSKSTANNHMRLFAEYGADQITVFGAVAKSQTLGDLTYSKALALLALPETERESFVESNNVADMSTRELERAIREKQAAEERADRAETMAAMHREQLEAEEREKEDLLRELDEAKAAAAAAERAEASFAKERTVLQAKITAAEASAELSRRETAQLLEKQKQAKETIKKLKESKESPEIPKTTLDKLQAEARQKALKEAKAEQEARFRELETQAKEAAAAADAAEREAKELKAKLAMASTDMAEFKAHFETTQGSVKRMLEVWSRIRDTDQATAERCRQAILAVARQMQGKVGA